jgi:XTP/dITP diphosphohydrolase
MNLKLIKGMRLVAATHNPGKAREIEALLDGNYEIVTAGSLNLPEPDETESTFTGNAMLKARHAAALSGEVCLADDSGLSVAALDGAPGIFSARWAGPTKDFTLAMQKVEQRLEEIGAAPAWWSRAWFTAN